MRSIALIVLIFSFIALISIAAPAQDDPGPIFIAQGPGVTGMGPMDGPHAIAVGPHPGPFGAWWKNSDVVKELQLSDAQVKQIEQTFLDYRLKLIDLRADVERQETKLQPLLEADQPNEHEVSSQVDLVVAARGKLEKTNTMMMLAIRRVLSVEQWKKLQAIEHRRGERNVFYRRSGDHEQWIFRQRRGDASEPPQPPAPPEAPPAPGDK
jgi:periplasmic protein CpxP/Spy